MSFVKCPKCGKIVDDFMGRCLRCKTPLTRVENSPTSTNGDLIYYSVAFIDNEGFIGDRTYSYIAENDEYSVGDTVVVPVGSVGEEKLGVIKEVNLVRSGERPPYPPSKTKKIKCKFN